MMIKRLICGVGLFLTAQSFPVLAAEPASVYQYYLNEGIKAFERHNDEEASRYFAWAEELDPSSQEIQKYIKALNDRARFEDTAADSTNPVYYPYFEEMLQKGQDALQRKDYESAQQYFYTAHLLDRAALKPLEYLNLVKRLTEGNVVVETTPILVQPAAKSVVSDAPSSSKAVGSALDQFEKPAPARVASVPVKVAPVPVKPEPVRSSATVAIPKKNNKAPEIVTIDEILQHAEGGRALLKVDLGTSVIVEGKNIQKFLVVTEGPVSVKTTTRDQVQIDALKIGVTFLHIWDDAGRRTIYVQVVFPLPPEGEQIIRILDAEHAAPFKVHYSNDWSTYYLGQDIPGMTRKSVQLRESVGIEGETPYGYFDASGSTAGWHKPAKFFTYTTGLTGIPMAGTSNFNVRFFKGVLGFSATHGSEMGSFGYFGEGENTSIDSYVDAGRVILFPEDIKKHYSFNYARGTGGERSSYITKDVYSIEGAQTYGRLRINAELAQDDRTNAGVTGLRWEDGDFRTALNMRSTGKEFTTVTGTAPQQGMVGATWTTDTIIRKGTVGTFLDVYQDHIFYNPEDPDAVNYSLGGYFNAPINELYSMDGNLNYANAPGDISPRTYMGASTRLKRAFDMWGYREGSVYVGGSYQSSRYDFSPLAEYDRYGALTGVSIPLTKDLSFNGNYEYSWLTDIASGDTYNPAVLTLGLNYYKQITNKISGNMGLDYRQENNFGGTNSFLAGEDSLAYSAGVSYAPANDVTLFLDGRLNNVWGKINNNVSYNDLDLRMGLRSRWGTGFSWDPEGTIEGIVFKDRNSNGKFDKGEDGIPAAKVKIGHKEVMTDSKGWYHGTVMAKKATVSVISDSIPSGFIFSTPALARVMVRQGLRDRVDFGLSTRSGIFGVVFVDKNGNGTPDPGDLFVGRVKMMLDGKVAQISDPQGAYFFTNVAPGKHMITLDIKSLPVKYIPQVKLKNEVNVIEGTTYILHIPVTLKEVSK